jgi:hypothetical protein
MKTRLLIIIIIILCSCKRKDTSSIKEIDLLSPPESEIINLSEIATDVNYVPLQTNESSLIRYIINFKTVNGKFYINTQKELICFNNNGYFLYKLDQEGRGPGEYQFIGDFDISYNDEILIFLDSRRVMIFINVDNKFVFYKTLNLENDPSNVDFIPGQTNILISYYCVGNEPFRNLIINLNGDTLKPVPNSYKYTKVSQMMFASVFENINYSLDNKLYFKYWLSDTVFSIDQSNNITPSLILNSEGNQLTSSILANLSSIEQMSESIIVSFIIESSHYLFYRYTYKKVVYFRVYDKVAQKTMGKTMESSTQAKWVIDDIIGGVDFEPRYCINGTLYSWVEAITLKNYVSSEKFKNSIVKDPEKKKALETLAYSLKETDNPVLIVVALKN